MKTTLDIIKKLPEYELLSQEGIDLINRRLEAAIRFQHAVEEYDAYSIDFFKLKTKFHTTINSFGVLLTVIYKDKIMTQEFIIQQRYQYSDIDFYSFMDRCIDLSFDFTSNVEDNRWMYDAYYGTMNEKMIGYFDILHKKDENFNNVGETIKYYINNRLKEPHEKFRF